MEHTEEAGVHSGDSSCAIPPPTLSAEVVQTIERYTRGARARSSASSGSSTCSTRSRTNASTSSRRTRVRAARCRSSARPPAFRWPRSRPASCSARPSTSSPPKGCCARRPAGRHVAVKEAVLPFNRFPEVDTILGPEMRSTGEVMGIDRTFGMAFAKSQAGAGNKLPARGHRVPLARRPRQGRGDRRGPPLLRARLRHRGDRRNRPAPRGERDPRRHDRRQGRRGRRRRRGRAHLVGQGRSRREHAPRAAVPAPTACTSAGPRIVHGVACITTVAAAMAAAAGIAEEAERDAEVRSLQEYHADGQLRFEV